jgi:hypothetical protein
MDRVSSPDCPAGPPSRPTPPVPGDPADAALIVSVIARLVGGDPLAPVLIRAAAEGHPRSFAALSALAIIDGDPDGVRRAQRLARTRRERQHGAVIEEYLTGASDRARLLAREHLAEFPDDIVISWLVSTR